MELRGRNDGALATAVLPALGAWKPAKDAGSHISTATATAAAKSDKLPKPRRMHVFPDSRAEPEKAQDATAPWRKIVSSEDIVSPGADNAVAIHESTLYLLVDKDAPNRKLIALDLSHPAIASATLLVPQSDAVLGGVYAASDGIYLESKRGVTFELRRSAYGPQLKWEKIALPYGGTVSTVDANVLLPGIIFGLESWKESGQAFIYNPSSNQVSNTSLVQKHPADFSGYEAREVEATSADGTKVPLSILCRKGLVLDGSHPVLYEGYGAYPTIRTSIPER